MQGQSSKHVSLLGWLSGGVSVLSIVAPLLAIMLVLSVIDDVAYGRGGAALATALVLVLIWVVSAPLGVVLGVRRARSGSGSVALVVSSLSTAGLVVGVAAVLAEWARP